MRSRRAQTRVARPAPRFGASQPLGTGTGTGTTPPLRPEPPFQVPRPGHDAAASAPAPPLPPWCGYRNSRASRLAFFALLLLLRAAAKIRLQPSRSREARPQLVASFPPMGERSSARPESGGAASPFPQAGRPVGRLGRERGEKASCVPSKWPQGHIECLPGGHRGDARREAAAV